MTEPCHVCGAKDHEPYCSVEPSWRGRIASLEAENRTLRNAVVTATERAESAERQLAEARGLADERFAEIKRARVIIDGLTTYRERLVTMPMQSTDLMRARLRELAEPDRDDFDRAVIATLDDLDALLARAALPQEPGSDGEGR